MSPECGGLARAAARALGDDAIMADGVGAGAGGVLADSRPVSTSSPWESGHSDAEEQYEG